MKEEALKDKEEKASKGEKASANNGPKKETPKQTNKVPVDQQQGQPAKPSVDRQTGTLSKQQTVPTSGRGEKSSKGQ